MLSTVLMETGEDGLSRLIRLHGAVNCCIWDGVYGHGYGCFVGAVALRMYSAWSCGGEHGQAAIWVEHMVGLH
jgi:hypothetical protein